ncbi:HAD family phosphatase [Faecalicatena orotica]|uniref:HAD superfamily hydrolase (TIGR01509 family) n=2 Tax=Faecalicatena orotica TaxID=1544 RepID=A0A2Y9BAN4_9FIRM|nr:HAD family phosphatase [Faecalicatena orotica]PWJ31468.1 HAD superfamily hydrolase (TIGR01509 family) [Faecalicatena orotica]SSA54675.1 haloacid dehalogenase superfamily, subfamily IA, variant 3 with third motif having DD or ED [Faecalicatena orotica]
MSNQFQTPIYGLVFDMDGLIFNSERVVQRSWDYAGEVLGYERFGEHIYNTIGFNVKRREAYFREHVCPDFPMDRFSVLTREKYHQIVDEEGLEVKPGAEELLRFAKEEGYKAALATSSRRAHASSLMAEHGLLKYFDGAVYGDMVSAGKPDPEIYQKACAGIGVAPEHALALEDAPSGIRSAVAAGMRAVIIPDLVEPDQEILNMAWHRYDTLLDVLSLLKEGETC